VDWSNPSASTLKPSSETSATPFDSNPCVNAMIHSTTNFNCITQPGNVITLDPLAYGYTGYRLVYRRFKMAPQSMTARVMVFAQTVTVGSDVNHTGIRWYILGQLAGTANRPWRISQEGTYSPDDDDRWLPSPGIDAIGDVAIGCSVH